MVLVSIRGMIGEQPVEHTQNKSPDSPTNHGMFVLVAGVLEYSEEDESS